MQKTWGSLSLIVKMGILAGLVGLITPGCSSISLNATQQVTQSENIPNTNAPSRDPQVNIGNSANASKVVALQKGMQYKEARKILQQQGWQPDLPASASEFPNLQNLALKEVFDLGYKEVKDCSGSGLGLCRYEFTNQKGERLVVVATNAESETKEPVVRNWFIEGKANTTQQSSTPSVNKENPPFVGTKFFNFLGGNGTGKSITIDANGNTTVKLHGTVSSSVEYSGKFSNPIIFNNGSGLLLKDGKIYSLKTDGQVAQGCKVEGKPCESELLEASSPPDDDRFRQQNLSQQLFKQVRQLNKECGFYDVTSPCSSPTYTFRDTVLTTTRVGTESITHTLILNQPVSKQQALIYAQILNDGDEIELSKLTTQAEKIVYRGCPYDAGGSALASLCKAELSLTNDGSISRIKFTHSSP